MLVLTRRVGESIVIGDNVRIIVRRISGKRVRLAIDAAEDVAVRRGELENIAGKTARSEVEPLKPLPQRWPDRRVS